MNGPSGDTRSSDLVSDSVISGWFIDGFCGAGGAAEGYRRAGFQRIVGIDTEPQPRYPFEFVQGDFFDVFPRLLAEREVIAAHASPVCKGHSKLAVSTGRDYSDTTWQVAESRRVLQSSGVPWVIENVPGAPMRADYRLCGCMFGLPGLRRERWFETSWQGFDLRSPCAHIGQAVTVSGHGEQGRVKRAGLPVPDQEARKAAMGIGWMNRDELAQAIPPAFTEYVGAQLLAHIESEVAA